MARSCTALVVFDGTGQFPRRLFTLEEPSWWFPKIPALTFTSDSYSDSLREYVTKSKKKKESCERLESLDKWIRSELPTQLRTAGYITVNQLSDITEWKMLRGQWRPRNLQLVKSNTQKEVETLSKEAFKFVDEAKKKELNFAEPIKILSKVFAQFTCGNDFKGWKFAIPTTTKSDSLQMSEIWWVFVAQCFKFVDIIPQLKGVGPATASAVLSAYDSLGRFAFMSDEALQATIKENPLTYTVPQYLKMNQKVSECYLPQFQYSKRWDKADVLIADSKIRRQAEPQLFLQRKMQLELQPIRTSFVGCFRVQEGNNFQEKKEKWLRSTCSTVEFQVRHVIQVCTLLCHHEKLRPKFWLLLLLDQLMQQSFQLKG